MINWILILRLILHLIALRVIAIVILNIHNIFNFDGTLLTLPIFHLLTFSPIILSRNYLSIIKHKLLYLLWAPNQIITSIDLIHLPNDYLQFTNFGLIQFTKVIHQSHHMKLSKMCHCCCIFDLADHTITYLVISGKSTIHKTQSI